MAGKFARRTMPVGCDDLQIGRRHRGVAIKLHAWQPGEVTEAASNRGLVLGRLHNPGDCLVPARTLAAAKIDLAIGGERIGIISIGAKFQTS